MNPSPEIELEAWRAVEKAVERLYEFFQYARELEEMLPGLLNFLCIDQELPLQQKSVAVKLLAKTFHYAFHFDELKIVTPSISNDFSYYRRVISRMRNTGDAKKGEKRGQVTEEVANMMSFHFAYPTPVMKVLVNAVVQMPDLTSLVAGLAEIANVACEMLLANTEDAKLLQCLMTGCIILVDHTSPLGAFHPKSPIRLKPCINALRNGQGTEPLLNSIRFGTLHLSDDSTPPSIAKALSG